MNKDEKESQSSVKAFTLGTFVPYQRPIVALTFQVHSILWLLVHFQIRTLWEEARFIDCVCNHAYVWWPSGPYGIQGRVRSSSMVHLHSHYPKIANTLVHGTVAYECVFNVKKWMGAASRGIRCLTASSVMVSGGNFQSDYYWVSIYCLSGSSVLNKHNRVNKDKRDGGMDYCCCYQMAAQHTPSTGEHW